RLGSDARDGRHRQRRRHAGAVAALSPPRQAPKVQIAPESRIATGTMTNARWSELWSETQPMNGIAGTSPRRCRTRMESATAVARSVAATTVTIAELTGPVDMKANTSATTSAVM